MTNMKTEISRYEQVADLMEEELAGLPEGSPAPRMREAVDRHGLSLKGVHEAYRLLQERGVIRRASARRTDGYVVTGRRRDKGLRPDLRRIKSTGYLWPRPMVLSSGAQVCPVPDCGSSLRGVPRPVYGYCCTNCRDSGRAVQPLLGLL